MSEAKLSLIETTICGKKIRMRLVDKSDPPDEWIDLQLAPDDYVFGEKSLAKNPERMPLGAVRLAALDRAQTAIAAEIARLSRLVGSNS